MPPGKCKIQCHFLMSPTVGKVSWKLEMANSAIWSKEVLLVALDTQPKWHWSMSPAWQMATMKQFAQGDCHGAMASSRRKLPTGAQVCNGDALAFRQGASWQIGQAWFHALLGNIQATFIQMWDIVETQNQSCKCLVSQEAGFIPVDAMMFPLVFTMSGEREATVLLPYQLYRQQKKKPHARQPHALRSKQNLQPLFSGLNNYKGYVIGYIQFSRILLIFLGWCLGFCKCLQEQILSSRAATAAAQAPCPSSLPSLQHRGPSTMPGQAATEDHNVRQSHPDHGAPSRGLGQ